MNNRSVIRAIAIAVLVAAAAIAIGVGAYNAGMAQGIAESGRIAAAAPGGTPYVYVWPRPWGFGFGFFPFLLLLFVFFLVRSLFWRGPRWYGPGWGGGWGSGPGAVPPGLEEWHRRAHEQMNPPAGRTTA